MDKGSIIKLFRERWRKPGLFLRTVLEASLWEWELGTISTSKLKSKFLSMKREKLCSCFLVNPPKREFAENTCRES